MSADADVVQQYLERNYQLVFWPAVGDVKGPSEKDWPRNPKTLSDYKEGHRVGLLTGIELTAGKYLHDVDLDWAPGAPIALAMLPPTGLVYGRQSKKISHCFYTAAEPLPSYKYEDVDKVTLIELRGTKLDGSIGFQSMAPPSVWSKGAQREPLTFVRSEGPAHVEVVQLKARTCLAAVGMLFARHFGQNGFGHDVRLAWAGFLLRAAVPIDDLVAMGEAISIACNNREVQDVRRVVESTAAGLLSDGKKVKGGPALARMLGADGKQVIARINEWLGRDSDFVRNGDGAVVKDNQHNIRRAIDMLGRTLAHNQFSDKLLIDGVPMEDKQLTQLWLKIDEEYRFRPTYMFFEKVVSQLAWDQPFHPVKDYLATLAWDGTPRLDLWLVAAAGAEDSPYTRAVSSILLIAAVRRIKHPGEKYDEMLILEGAQGLNKSSALRLLCPHGDWFSDDLPLNTTPQKIIESTLGKWIIEASDLAGKRKTEIEHLKATLSRQIDGPARMAYAHMPVERPRQFVVIGTTNSSVYLNDPTGARRFWPVTIRAFSTAWMVANRDQLWAEAIAREHRGESIRLDEGLWLEAARHQEKRREMDPWEGPVREILSRIPESLDGKVRAAVDDVWAGLNIPIERRDRIGGLRIAEILHRLGYKRTTVRKDGKPVTGYVTDDVPRGNAEEREPGEDDSVGELKQAEKDAPPF